VEQGLPMRQRLGAPPGAIQHLRHGETGAPGEVCREVQRERGEHERVGQRVLAGRRELGAQGQPEVPFAFGEGGLPGQGRAQRVRGAAGQRAGPGEQEGVGPGRAGPRRFA
ncbi:MAG: hypothetical protein ACK559_18880, partial [bacterium]